MSSCSVFVFLSLMEFAVVNNYMGPIATKVMKGYSDENLNEANKVNGSVDLLFLYRIKLFISSCRAGIIGHRWHPNTIHFAMDGRPHCTSINVHDFFSHCHFVFWMLHIGQHFYKISECETSLYYDESIKWTTSTTNINFLFEALYQFAYDV